jgi:single-stranded DNA-binding protein
MAAVLVTGDLYGEPRKAVSKSGNPYLTATVRERVGNGSRWWRVFVFPDEIQVELDGLGDGDSVSVRGEMQAEIYEGRDGESRLSLSIMASALIALRRPGKRRARRHERVQDGPDPSALYAG